MNLYSVSPMSGVHLGKVLELSCELKDWRECSAQSMPALSLSIKYEHWQFFRL